MNKEQFLQLLKTAMQIAGTLLIGRKLFGFDAEAWTAFSGGILMIAPVVWDILDHRKNQLIASVDAMSGVAGVVTKNTEEGRAIAEAVPSSTVVAAGSAGATAMAHGRAS